MKLVIIVPDGMPDVPQAELKEQTPLQVAKTPTLDGLAAAGSAGMVRVLAEGQPTDTLYALMTVMGYANDEMTGRGYYEALDRGIELKPDEWVARCQLVTTDGIAIVDPVGGRTSTTESRQLINALNDHMGAGGVRFHFGNRDNHLVTATGEFPHEVQHLYSPWEVIGKPFADYLPAEDSVAGKLMAESRTVLKKAEVNKLRRDLGENEANMAYLYGAGRHLNHKTIEDRVGKTALVSYSSMARGLAHALKVSKVVQPEMSREPWQELRQLALAAHECLQDSQVVVLHVSFADKYASPMERGSLAAKIQGIERIDEYLLKPLSRLVSQMSQTRLAIVPTFVSNANTRTHMTSSVPLLLVGPGVPSDNVTEFDESSATWSGQAIDARSTSLIEHLRDCTQLV